MAVFDELPQDLHRNDIGIISTYNEEKGTVLTQVSRDNQIRHKTRVTISDEYDKVQFIKLGLYKLLSEYTGVITEWGILSGIRPTKIAYKEIKTHTDEEVKQNLITNFDLSEGKANLVTEVAHAESKCIEKSGEKGKHIYIGIPFCKSVCTYCSFTSFSIDKYEKNGEDVTYVNSLVKEIEAFKDEYSDVKTIYVGGGTPSSLSYELLETLLKAIKENFDLKSIIEYTFEAGRVDTLNEKKLKLLREYGVKRISLNPQTMNDKTLAKINRTHTSEQFVDVYKIARAVGFSDINVDLIIGLTEETIDDFSYSLNKVLELNPEAVTVHALAVKRGTTLKDTEDNNKIYNHKEAIKMSDLAYKTLCENELKPYYLYRQKNMIGLGNLENIGYAKEGYESLYNVATMVEEEDVLAFGAGATSKSVNSDKVDRSFNVVGVEEYIERLDEMIQRKKSLFSIK